MSRISLLQRFISPQPYSDSEWPVMVSRYDIGPFLDFYIPYLWTKSYDGEGEVRIPFFGDVSLSLSKEKYCTICSEEAVKGRICKGCLNSKLGTLVSCILEGPSKVFGRECELKDPPCGFEENTKYCSKPQVIYIGMFGEKLKVGTSSLERGGIQEGTWID
ncbi:MAG: hypothetical protein ACTSR0_03565 [Candidatus Asgardarchaeia archaeon]